MKLKDPERMRPEFFTLHPKLQLIICDVICWGIQHGEEPTWTCFNRTEDEQAALVEAGKADDKVSVHQLGRGADARLFQRSELNYMIQGYINGKYTYDPKRPFLKTLLTHDGTKLHHHFQVYDV